MILNRLLLFVLLVTFNFPTFGQKNEVKIDMHSAMLFYSIDSENIDYDEFILTITNIQNIEDFTLIEEDGYATAKIQKKCKTKISYIICNSGKSKRKKILTFILKARDKRKHKLRLLFFKDTVNIYSVPKDTIVTYGVLDHAPLLISNFHISDNYSIKDKESNVLIEYPSLRLLSVYLKRLNAGEYLFFSGEKLLFKFRVIPPKNKKDEKKN